MPNRVHDTPAPHPYGRYYFRHYAGGAYETNGQLRQFFDTMATAIVRDIAPRTVLDAGCAMGLLVDALRRHGVEAYGIDISDYAIRHAPLAAQPYCRVGSLIDPLPRRYDLIVCVEVLEHLAPEDAAAAIGRLCDAADDILFSSTPTDYDEVTHLNVQPVHYWAGLFAQHGFVRDVDFDAAILTPWAARFRRHRDPLHRAIRDYERRFWQLAAENGELRSLALHLQSEQAAGEQVAEILAGHMLDREQEIWLLRASETLRDTYIRSLRDHLAAKEHDLRVLADHAEATRTALAEHQRLLGRRNAEVTTLQARLANVARQSQEAGHRAAAATARAETLATRLDETAARLQAIEASRAWRAALQLRALRITIAPPGSRRARWAAAALGVRRTPPAVAASGDEPARVAATVVDAPAAVQPAAETPAASVAQPQQETPADTQTAAAAATSHADTPTFDPGTPALSDASMPVTAPADDKPALGPVLIVNGSMGDMERYRCHHTHEQLARLGVESAIANLVDPSLLEQVPRFDLIILHRVQWGPLVREIVRTARQREGVTILFDIDDLLFVPEIADEVQALALAGPSEQVVFRVGMRRFREALHACDGVLGASDAIAGAADAAGRPSWVHRNALSQELLDLSEQARIRRVPSDARVVIGYASGSRTHNRDFAQAADALRKLLATYPHVELRIIGQLDLDSQWQPWLNRITRVPFLDWRELPAALAEFDINLAPLEIGSAFCAGKSELKYFEAAAVGVPTVASRWGSFQAAIRPGDNGFLAGDTSEWFDALQRLIADAPVRRAIGERARQDVLDRYSPDVRAQALKHILTEATAMRSRPPAAAAGMPFPEHELAHRLLDGFRGLEVGAAAHNPFGLRTRNVAPVEDYDYYAGESRRQGIEPAVVDIAAQADAIPVPDRSEDFVLSSHVVEHLPNPIRAFREWNRIVRDEGYVFMIVPLKGALPADAPRELTTLEHLVADYETGATIDTHPYDDAPGGRMGHYHTFTPDSLHAVVRWMRAQGLCQWQLVAREDIDTKVGNGFTLAYRVHHTPRAAS